MDKKWKYRAYNVIIDKKTGGKMGRPYKTEVGETSAEAKRKCIALNKRWNRVVGKKTHQAVFSHVKKIGGTKKRKKTPLWSI